PGGRRRTADSPDIARVLHTVQDDKRPVMASSRRHRGCGVFLFHLRDRDDSLRCHGLADGTKESARQRDLPAGSSGELIAFPHGDHLELETGSFCFEEHARSLQEDEAWLALMSETPDAADDLVFRA
ncbi:MAG TPA: hypothetical protein VK821_08165, partial [Dehalococcoidia bacterium]|nr:hypothetical protein [Dehalococcoidia bacterium]